MKPFSKVCQTKSLCAPCLSDGSAIHRAQWRKKYDGVPADGAPCNYNNTLVELTVSAKPPTPSAEITVANILAFIKEWTTGEQVDEATILSRKKACGSCGYKMQGDAGAYCSAPGSCGCTVEPRKVLFVTIEGADITRYKERPDKLLCKHPERSLGKGWPLP